LEHSVPIGAVTGDGAVVVAIIPVGAKIRKL
jgi:hypothetical protein